MPSAHEKMLSKAHRSLLRSVAFLIFSVGLSLILYVAPAVIETSLKSYVVIKQVSAAATRAGAPGGQF